MVVKFQAYDAEATGESGICQNADYDAAVSFSFDAPALEANGATFTITSPYEGAKNYYSYGEVVDQRLFHQARHFG